MNEIQKRVLKSFEHWGKEKLDLHTLFEAGENDPDARTAVFDAVEGFVKDGCCWKRETILLADRKRKGSSAAEQTDA